MQTHFSCSDIQNVESAEGLDERPKSGDKDEAMAVIDAVWIK